MPSERTVGLAGVAFRFVSMFPFAFALPSLAGLPPETGTLLRVSNGSGILCDMAAEDTGSTGDNIVSGLDYWHTGLPPFASMRTANGLTELRVRSLIGEPFKRGVVGGIIAFFGIFFASILAAVFLRGAPPWLRWVPLLCLGACTVLFVAGLLFLPVVAFAAGMFGEAIVGEDKLILKDIGNSYEIPRSEIRAIRHVIYPGSRVEMDLSGPLSHLFFRGKRTAMEIEVPGGRLELFRFWEEEKVAWLAEGVNRLVFPSSNGVVRAPPDERQAIPRVIASRTYGKPRRTLLRVGLIVGLTATTFSGWYAYRGLSSLRWPAVQGRVERSLYEEDHRGDSSSYRAEIQYTYQVAGASHTNDHFGYFRAPADGVVKDLVTAHPVGSAITVYYDRAHPSKSIVIRGVGPLGWLVVGLSLAPLLLVLPLARNPTTPQQDALAAKYRTGPQPRTKAMDQLYAVVRWSAPPDAWRDTIRAARRAATFMALRVTAITAVAVWAAHHWFGAYCPPDSWRVVLAISGLVGVAMILQAISAQLTRPPPPAYAITEAGVLVGAKEKPFVRWAEIRRFTVEPCRHSPDVRTFTLYLKSARRPIVLLPGGEADARILSELSSHLPEVAPQNASRTSMV